MSAILAIIAYFTGNVISYHFGVCERNEFAYGVANAFGIVLAMYLTGHLK